VCARLVEQKEIDELYRGISRQHEGTKEDYFGLLYLVKEFNIPLEEAVSYNSFGGNDYGIDGFYHDKERKNFYIFQFKWSENHLLFKDSLERLIRNGLERVFGNPLQDPNQNNLVVRMKTVLFENQSIIDRIFIHFVFNGDVVKAEQSKVLELLRENLESKKHVIDAYFNRQVDMAFQYVTNERKHERRTTNLYIKKNSAKYTIDVKDSLKISAPGSELNLNFMPLNVLYHMYRDLGEKFFEKNIRSGLDEGQMTNVEIRKSLKRILNSEEPTEHFTFYHNGVALTAEAIESDGRLTLTEPRLLNGAQTVKTLKQFVEENKQDDRVKEMLERVKVAARIVRSNDEEFLTRVTINNNRQNPITPWNLRANDIIQLHFEDHFRETLSIYYERRENAFRNLTDDDLEEMNIEISNRRAIEIRKFAQTLLALQGEVDRISQLKEVFENEKWYKDTFKERYRDVDPRQLILLYKIQYRLSAIVNEIKNAGEKYQYVGKAKSLLWCLTIQGIMNSDNYDKYVESYGTSLILESDFNLVLKNLASTKLRFILRDTLEKRKYEEYFYEMQYSFLKTKSTLSDCMDTARRSFGWYKKNL
jgi:hypothetical protein